MVIESRNINNIDNEYINKNDEIDNIVLLADGNIDARRLRSIEIN